MRAGCHIKLPREITMKRAVINVQSNDNACFAWSVVTALYPAEDHVYRESSYPHYTTVLNLQDIEFPVTVNQIKKFELLNDISIKVYSIEEKNIVPIRLSELKKDKHVNLLYVEDNNVGHFAWIKNLSRLVSWQLSCGKRRQYICDRCLHYFGSNDKLQSHTVDCREMNECAIRLPSDKDKWLTFNNYNRKERLPFIVYADLECVLEKTEEERNYQHHKDTISGITAPSLPKSHRASHIGDQLEGSYTKRGDQKENKNHRCGGASGEAEVAVGGLHRKR
ncbi:uncharacterized protein [Polyergus mexicanus]|uniref:uncharacterized protein n=1 Tax=Polyergus mexicanus TaxID=615972 RepID=UPI0038B49BE3